MKREKNNFFYYYSIFFSISIFSFSFLIFLILIDKSVGFPSLFGFTVIFIISTIFTTYFYRIFLKNKEENNLEEKTYNLIDNFEKMVIFTENGKITYINKKGKEFLKRISEKDYENLREMMSDISSEEKCEKLLNAFKKLPEGKFYSIEWDYSTNKILKMDIKKENENSLIIIMDIKKLFDSSETTIKVYEEIVKTLFKKINGFCWSGVLNDKNEIDYVFCIGNVDGVTGYNRKEFVTLGKKIILDEDMPALRKKFQEIKNSDLIEHKYRIVTKNGEIKWIYETIISRKNEDGMLSYLLGIAMDMTEEELYKKRIESQKKFLENVFENLREMILIFDIEGKIIYTNKSADVFFSKDLKGEKIFNVIDLDLLKGVKELKNIKEYKEKIKIEKDGEDLYFNTRLISLINEKGKNLKILILENITEEIKREELIKRIEKLESLGLFAGGIAHGFNNILFTLKGSLSILKKNLHESREKETIGKMEDALLKAELLSNKLLVFAKGGGCVKKETQKRELENLILKIIENLKNEFGVEIKFISCPENFTINCDDIQISEAIYNIVVNSCEASIGEKCIVVFKERVIKENDGTKLEISIEDSGEGVIAENLKKVFDPYFTTKGGHIGLGLSISHRIIKNHNGEISLYNLEKGTGVKILLPIKLVEEREKIKENKEFHIKALVMDDDELVREVFKDMLEELNCSVDVAGDGETAIEMYKYQKKTGKPYDVVFLDLTIENGMGGKETIHELKKIDPQVKAVISSGYSKENIMSQFEKHGFYDVLKKPFEINDLQKILERVKSDKVK